MTNEKDCHLLHRSISQQWEGTIEIFFNSSKSSKIRNIAQHVFTSETNGTNVSAFKYCHILLISIWGKMTIKMCFYLALNYFAIVFYVTICFCFRMDAKRLTSEIMTIKTNFIHNISKKEKRKRNKHFWAWVL
jgi:hypothetical protein